jgi:hypothetical protein
MAVIGQVDLGALVSNAANNYIEANKAEFKSDVAGPQGIQGPAGVDGEGVTITEIVNLPDSSLQITFSDGTVHTTGMVKGKDGEDGTNVTITNISNTSNGTLFIEFSDGTSHTTASLIGPQGPKGPRGDHVHHLSYTRSKDSLGNEIGPVEPGYPGNVDIYTQWSSQEELPEMYIGEFEVRNGDSAYQYAVDGGFTGTNAEFITTLGLIDDIVDAANSAVADAEAQVVLATGSAIDAQSSEDDAELSQWVAEAHKMTANSYATEPVDTLVNHYISDGDGTFTAVPQAGVYSALHYKTKAQAALNEVLGLGNSYVVANHTEKDALLDLSVGDTVFVTNDGDGKWVRYIATAVTTGQGSSTTWTVMMDQDTYLNANTAVDIKTAYESNADTNAYTDSEKTKVGYITVSSDIDLDEQKSVSNRIKEIFEDTNEPTGFIREFPETMGIIELCTGVSDNGTKVIHKDGYGNVTVTNDGLWSDGSSANARTFRLSPYNGNDVEIYIEGTKFRFDTHQELLLDNTTGLKFIYLDTDGTLKVDSTFSFDYFEDRPIVATVYGNAIDQTLVNFGDERHGIQMDGETHRYLHFTQGTQYVSGMEIQGLAKGNTTYTQITSGKAYDEDIYMEPTQQTSAPHLYRIGTDWYVQADGNDVAYMPSGTAQYNPTDGTNYSLADVTGNDAMIVFFCLTNNIEFPYVKILGQEVYGSTNVARANIESALSNLVLDGLPSPEFLPIGAVIVRDGGDVQELSDGSLYYDLRNVKVAGSGSSSGTTQYHEDLLGTDDADSHPASAISVTPQGNISADTVQLALEELQSKIDTLNSVQEV